MSQDDFLLNNNLKGINNNLDTLNGNLNNLHSKLGNLNSEIGSINDKQEALDGRMGTLSDIINDFIKTDNTSKELQLAETRQGNLKQDMNHKYGYYAEIRRMVLGILQAVDSGIVSHEVLQNAVETLMIKTPDYWMAPALVAVVAWIRNDQENTEKALKEALRRDDYKTTLFFMLLMRRLGRNDACYQWMQRYLMHQDPYNLDREFITVLEAAATGSFPPASRQLMMSTVNKWIEQLTQTDQYINEQKNEWLKFFLYNEKDSNKQYPLLQKYCTNWPDLATSIKKAGLHNFLQTYFKNILSSPTDYSKTSKNQLDEILSLLITNFDDEELELQKNIRFNQRVIDKNGNPQNTKSFYSSENKVFEEKTNFLQMLTNAAFIPELAGASKATQSLAVAISQPWIIEAHDSYTAEYRMNYIANVNLDIDGFQTAISDGSDEVLQLEKHSLHWKQVLRKELSKEGFPYMSTFIAFFPFFISLFGKDAIWANLFLYGVSAFFLLPILSYRSERAKIKTNIAEREKSSQEVLRGCIAELVDFRKEYNIEDSKAEEVRSMLKSVSAEEFLGNSRDTKAML